MVQIWRILLKNKQTMVSCMTNWNILLIWEIQCWKYKEWQRGKQLHDPLMWNQNLTNTLWMVILKRELQVITASTSLDKLITWMKKMCINLFLPWRRSAKPPVPDDAYGEVPNNRKKAIGQTPSIPRSHSSRQNGSKFDHDPSRKVTSDIFMIILMQWSFGLQY